MPKPSNPRGDRNRSTAHAPPNAPRWRPGSRALLILLLLLLPPIGAILYAGPAWAQVCYRLITDGGLLLFWLAAAVGWGLFLLRAAKVWERETPTALQWATAAALGLGMESLVLLGLGLAGWLNAIWAWGLLIGGCAVGIFCLKRWEREAGANAPARWLKQPARWEWLWLLATPFIALTLTAAMLPPGMLWNPGEPHGYDVVEYHLQVPREWYEAGRIVPLENNVFSYFPFNVEMHYLLAMHLRHGPWAAMYLAQLMHAVFIALTMLAVYGFASRYSRRAPAVLAALSLLTIPWLTQLASIAYDEGGFLLFGILAIGWSLSATFDSNVAPAPVVLRRSLRRFALAGAMAGFSAGSKLTGVPEVLVAIPVVSMAAAIWLAVSRCNRLQALAAGRWSAIAVYCLTGLLTFSPWMLRNMAWAHNPVFPELMPLLGKGHFNDAQVDRWEAAHKPPPTQRSASARLTALVKEVGLGWQFGYLLLPMGMIAFALSIRRPQAWFLFGLLLILAVFWLAFTHLQARFFLLAAPISALLVAQIHWRRIGAWLRAIRFMSGHGAIDAGAALRNLATGTAIGAAVLVGVFAAIALWRTNDNLFLRLYGPGVDKSAPKLLASDPISLVPDLPSNATLVLIGDARAFSYSDVPMTRLRYRTVFDVKGEGPDFVTRWAGPEARKSTSWTWIVPEEFGHLVPYYRDLPRVPEEVLRKTDAFHEER